MRTIRRHRILLIMLAVLSLAVVGCGNSGDTATPIEIPGEEATPIEIPGPAATDAFDVEAAVVDYLANIPEGYMAVGDLVAFKDAQTVGGALLIDVREVDEYASGHIPGAVNIPIRTLGDNLDLIPTDRQVFIYCQSGYRAALATSSLRILGYDNVVSYPPSYKGWTEAGEEVSTVNVVADVLAAPDIEPALFDAVNRWLAEMPEGYVSAGDVVKVRDAIGAGAFMLDVRTDAEWAEGRIPGATHFSLTTLGEHLDEIPRDVTVITYCKSGYRAALAAAALHTLGFDNVKAFPASWNGWVAAGEPIEA